MGKDLFYVNMLLDMFKKSGSIIITDELPKITIKIKNSSEDDQDRVMIIHNALKLEQILKKYLDTISLSTNSFFPKDSRHTSKYYLINAWYNATNSDYEDVERFYERLITFFEDNTFNNFNNLTNIGSIGQLSDTCSNVYIKRSECICGFETPHELNFFIGDSNYLSSAYNLPTIRYAIEEKDGRKIAYIYAIQGVKNPIVSSYHIAVDTYLRGMNNCISGMANRGVHSPSFIASLVMFIGILNGFGITDIIIPDYLVSRDQRSVKKNAMTEEEIEHLQYNLINKMMNTMKRFQDEIYGFDITAYPNDIDNFMHIRTESILHSLNPIMNDFYRMGFDSSKEMTKDINERKIN